MLLALLVLALITATLAAPVVVRALSARARRVGARPRRARPSSPLDYDPGRERRAEQRARQLLRSCVNDEEWGMYRDLGFIRVEGKKRPLRAAAGPPPYAYLVYPHKPILAYVPASGQLLCASTAWSSPTSPGEPRGCPPPTTSWPSGWR